MRADARCLLVIAIALAGCGLYARGSLVTESDTGAPDAPASTSPGTEPASEGDSGATTVEVSPDAGATAEPFMYVSTESTLYAFAPRSKTWKVIADLTAKEKNVLKGMPEWELEARS